MSGITQSRRISGWKLGLVSVVAIGGEIASLGNCTLAQSNIIPDNTLGADSSVVIPLDPDFPVDVIDSGAVRGANLFHSFLEFNVDANREAYFFSPANIENILARVTGGNRSEILGILGTIGDSNANLFLINPNGIIFGPNAALFVSGSFVASTADSLVFDNGFNFSATNPQAPPLLTINTPIGLQTGANPGSIVNQSSFFGLEVQLERTLALVGGDVALEGGILFAPDGRIELGSLTGNSLVSLTPTDTGYVLGYKGVEGFQDITLTQAAGVATSGNGGGSIQVQGRNVKLFDGSRIAVNLLGARAGGRLSVNASESVELVGASTDSLFVSGLFAQATPTATGEGQDLTITTQRLLVSNGAQVSTSTLGSGKGGTLMINASEEVQVIGRSANGQFPSGLLASTEEGVIGDAGNLNISTQRLLVRDGALVSASTFGSGKGGNLIVDASESVHVIGESANGLPSTLSAQAGKTSTGNAGDMTISTAVLRVSDKAQVFTSTSGIGDAGNLNISTQQLLVEQGAQVGTGTFPDSEGNGGDLSVDASESVQVIGESGKIGSGLYIQASRNSTGDAGDLRISTPVLLVSDGAQLSARTSGSGAGGSLIVDASQSVQVIGHSANDDEIGSGLLVSTEGTGRAGQLTITTPVLLVSDGAQVSASTSNSGLGGSLIVDASQSVQVIGTTTNGNYRSGLFAQAGSSSTGDAGDLRISTSLLLVRDGAVVSAGTLGSGKGGSLRINASESVQLSGAGGLFVSATAGGTAGDLMLETGKLSIQDGASVTVSSPLGQAGNLRVASDSLFLDRGSIAAETAKSGAEGGANITLQVSDAWLMQNESLISARAFGTANGGNINTDSQFLVALPPEGPNGSDIIANAIQGNGGKINITTQAIFGIEFRPELTPLNDINASSEFGLDGVVEINTPDIDPSQGLANLPSEPVDTEVAQGCSARGTQSQSQFFVTGRNGLPPTPREALGINPVEVEWVSLNSESENASRSTISMNPNRSTPARIVEAQGWVRDANGKVILVASAPTVTPHASWLPPTVCRASQ